MVLIWLNFVAIIGAASQLRSGTTAVPVATTSTIFKLGPQCDGYAVIDFIHRRSATVLYNARVVVYGQTRQQTF